ncbi:MAG: BamA/TamA family outer membrane protein [Muribaculaceae bacterium]|nr:BamA/TamA family outer membrane protein [Muribaculaceae bacterium]
MRIRLLAVTSILLVLALSGGIDSAAAETHDSVPAKNGVIDRLIHYFASSNKHTVTTRPHFTFIGGPHYSKESGFGIGLVLGGNYSTVPSDTLLPLSNISIVGDIATKNLFMIGARGEHIFPENSRRINYRFGLRSMSSYFWGSGYDMGVHDSNKTKYRDLTINLSAAYEWRVLNGLYIGPMAEFYYVGASKPASVEVWEGQPLHHITAGAGIKLSFDTRDNHTGPHSGWLLEFNQMFYPKFFGNGSYPFYISRIAANYYHPLWRNATIATRIHADFSYGDTPWNMLPTLGSGSMRSYYEGRYRDKNAVDLTIELRQKVWRRSGVVLWGGIGNVFPKLSALKMNQFLPEFGIGYRWEFKRDANIRIDLGFGRRSSGFVFGLNESF